LTLSLPEGEVLHANRLGGSERRVDRRYRVELPLNVSWRDMDGKVCQAEGMARDISRTGIYFVVPTVIRADEPVQLEMVLPDEITHRGDLRINLLARPMRQERTNSTADGVAPGIAVAATLDHSLAEEPVPAPSTSG